MTKHFEQYILYHMYNLYVFMSYRNQRQYLMNGWEYSFKPGGGDARL